MSTYFAEEFRRHYIKLPNKRYHFGDGKSASAVAAGVHQILRNEGNRSGFALSRFTLIRDGTDGHLPSRAQVSAICRVLRLSDDDTYRLHFALSRDLRRRRAHSVEMPASAVDIEAIAGRIHRIHEVRIQGSNQIASGLANDLGIELDGMIHGRAGRSSEFLRLVLTRYRAVVQWVESLTLRDILTADRGHADALKALEHVQAASKELVDGELYALGCFNLADALHNLHEYDDAQRYAQEALREGLPPREELWTRKLLTVAAAERGDESVVEQHAEAARQLADDAGAEQALEAVVLFNVGLARSRAILRLDTAWGAIEESQRALAAFESRHGKAPSQHLSVLLTTIDVIQRLSSRQDRMLDGMYGTALKMAKDYGYQRRVGFLRDQLGL